MLENEKKENKKQNNELRLICFFFFRAIHSASMFNHMVYACPKHKDAFVYVNFKAAYPIAFENNVSKSKSIEAKPKNNHEWLCWR